MTISRARLLVVFPLLLVGCTRALNADRILDTYHYTGPEETEHFRIYLERDYDEEFRRSLPVWLEEIYEKAGALMETFPEQKTTVKIYSSPLRVEGQLEFFGYAGKEAIYSKKYHDTRRNLAHEYCHFLAARLAGVPLPNWFNEGLATFVSNHVDGPDRPTFEEEVFGFVHDDFLHDFSVSGETSITRLPTEARRVRRRYVYGSSFISFLVEEHGFGKILEALRGAKEKGGIESSLSECLGQSFAEIDERWVEFLRSHADPGRYDKYGLIRDWRVIGPFDKSQGRDLAYPPEEGVDLSASYRSLGQVVRWRRCRASHPVGVVDLRHLEFTPSRYVIAYAAAKVRSPRELRVVIRAGADAGLAIWLNGESIVRRSVSAGFRPDALATEATLREGENVLLVKTSRSGSAWRFAVRITDEAGRAVPGLDFPGG